MELLEFVKWEEEAHDQFTIQLQYAGLLSKFDINRAAVTEAIKKQEFGIKAYYEKLVQTPDLAKPFSLYGNSIRLSTFEKLNLMERETV
jgi:hypothetical protein